MVFFFNVTANAEVRFCAAALETAMLWLASEVVVTCCPALPSRACGALAGLSPGQP